MRNLTDDYLLHESEVRKHSDFDAAIKHHYGDSFNLPAPCKPNP